MKCFIRLITALLLISTSNAYSNETALYDPQVKANEALVRVLNLTEHSIVANFVSVNKKINNTASFTFSSYIRVRAGQNNFSINGHELSIDVKQGQFYTVVTKPDGNLTFAVDKKINKKGKSMIAVYNYSKAKTLSLKTANGKVTIIENVKPNATGYREINALSINMGIFEDTTKVRETNKQHLQKDKIKNIAIIDASDGVAIAISSSQINTRM
ncbi:hypothetical protein D5R81_13700 [Parashewanella spongiae]|uniref:Alginate biosynthesis protein AlgF n=1 Tax=Parashewanella spongiae TaxID=342950 RepID=A0A3A6THI3_9GAMM|nr:alginate O-acetyltransferase AlgF [Parashewanella spongiae]MCL1079023.1 alginate O-acetyltransferase AlgF [Parashewanella spongiae]RJY10956.1 hypothetical protein D5R81_13700 [Parashewanella spongiae]